ncbi:MAG: ABC transporter ATP-binding protein/permease [Clostridiales bacterium]|nr:ABC transporter ATP-binding protein/permease [Clostridiales bacterium]
MKTKNLYVELKNQFHKDNYVFFALAVAGSFLSALFSMAISWLIRELINTSSGAGSRSLRELALITVIMAVFFFLTSFLTYVSQPRYIMKAIRNYKEALFRKLTEKNITSFRSESTSTYLSALTNDSVAIETNYLEKEFRFLYLITSFFGSLGLMLFYSPLLTLVAVGVTILPLIVSLLTGKKLAAEEVTVSEGNKNFTATIGDCLNGFSVVKSFRAEKEITRLFSEENGKLEKSKFIRRKLQILVSTLGQLSGMIAQIGVFFAGAFLAVSGKGMTAGTVIMFVNLMNFVIQPVAELPGLLAARRASRSLIRKISESLEKSAFAGGSEELGTLDQGISMKNISFSYEEGKEVLHDVSVDFEAGKSYAIVGGSGSGKSTLLNLLLSGTGGAEYSGSILWDNKDLKNVSSDSLFDQVSSIDQNVFVFNSSIRDNITMFRDFPKAEVENAISRANLGELISERGTDYLCGENGGGLSGGEKQRISIARSLLKKSSVLLADEITAALDAQTSHRVTSDILDLTGITRIVVTHDLEESLLKRYDRILVMKDGRLQEQGTFDELMEKQGYFHALFTIAD